VKNPFDLSGRAALVTGAASGIGKETACVLARMGATVFACDRDHAGVEETVKGLPNHPIALRHDVTLPEDWAAVVEVVKARSGRLDVLVNNAGVMLKRTFMETTLEEFRLQQRINVESVFLGMQACLPLMQKTASEFSGSSSVINVSSVYGQVAGPAFSAYSASKGAVRLLSKAVALEFAKRGVRVNSIHPGPTATNLGAKWDPPKDEAGNILAPEQARALWESRIPVGRLGLPGDIAGAIAFLACDASTYMTGSELTVDGGYTVT
jgi:NAD(P)-dependent dehydrogenase (short-subunit alcohol dehydrogenase family)